MIFGPGVKISVADSCKVFPLLPHLICAMNPANVGNGTLSRTSIFYDCWWYDPCVGARRIWEAKQQVESSIERSLESVGLIDERHQNEESQERLFR